MCRAIAEIRLLSLMDRNWTGSIFKVLKIGIRNLSLQRYWRNHKDAQNIHSPDWADSEFRKYSMRVGPPRCWFQPAETSRQVRLLQRTSSPPLRQSHTKLTAILSEPRIDFFPSIGVQSVHMKSSVSLNVRKGLHVLSKRSPLMPFAATEDPR